MITYLVNDVIVVNREKNLVNEVKVEPRLMNLLCLLMDNQGKLMSRSKIVELIWNGYGGGDEGLTQAISLLRKIFNDKVKKIIETIPKAGYVFNGAVRIIETTADIQKKIPADFNTGRKRIWLVAASLLVIFLVTLAGWNGLRSRVPTPKEMSKHNLNGIHQFKHQHP